MGTSTPRDATRRACTCVLTKVMVRVRGTRSEDALAPPERHDRCNVRRAGATRSSHPPELSPNYPVATQNPYSFVSKHNHLYW